MAPTRMNLLRAARRLQRVVTGAALLRRKREALVTELFRLARPAADARIAIGERNARAYPALAAALATHGEAALRAFGWPSRELRVNIEPGSVWGIVVSRILEVPVVTRTLAARGVAPQMTGLDTIDASDEFEHLVALLLEAAPREALIRRLGDALARTTRQVNSLERSVAPALRAQMAGVRRTLEEREREDRLRLKHLSGRRSS
jgi:H(+)-transporting ATP synthase subunit D